MRVLAAMSGGVDSAVAAARAVEAGPRRHRHPPRALAQPAVLPHRRPRLLHDRGLRTTRAGPPTCIGIPFYVWDLSDRFHEDVVEDFMAEYAAGRTPNPCLRCNEKIKFAAVLDRAIALGFDAVATGHYAQLVTGDGRADRDAPRGRHGQGPVLRPRRARPRSSSRTRCSRSATPASPRSATEAARRGLPVAQKPDSHDICFISDGDTAGWLRDKLGVPAVGRDRRPRDRGGARHATRAPRLHDRPAQGPADRPAGRRTASRASCSTSSRSPAPSRSGRARRSPSTGSRASGRAGAARRPAGRCTAPSSCARTATSTEPS